MQANRPPRWILLLFFSAAALSGQEFILPDLILSKLIRPDVPQPDVYPDAAALWAAELPSFRRQYPIPAAGSFDIHMIVPGNSPAGSSDFVIAFPENLRNPASFSVPMQFYRMAAGTDTNLREGSDVFGKITIPEFGVLGGVLFVPFSTSGPRPWSGEINWARIGRLSADVRAGVKDGNELSPYGTARLSWNGGMLRPDSYYLNLHAYGFSDFGFSADAGTDLEFYFTDSDWSLISEIEGGAWYSSNDKDGFFRTAVAAGYRLPGAGLSFKAGADMVYSGSGGLRGAPFLGIHWLPGSDLSFFADTGLIIGFPESLDSVLRREKLNGFDSETPVHSRYRLGFIRDESNMISLRMDVSFGYGRFTQGSNGYITTVDDTRISGSAGLGYNLGSRRIGLSGSWDVSLLGNPDIWESRLEYSLDSMAFYISGGTEDAFIASYFPGIRGEQPMIGLGFDWAVSDNWELGSFAYAEMPWDVPSLIVSFEWRK